MLNFLLISDWLTDFLGFPYLPETYKSPQYPLTNFMRTSSVLLPGAYMSATRAVLVLVQTFAYHIALIPPNPTPPKGRYHTEEPYVLQIAPLIFKAIQTLSWVWTFFEILAYVKYTFLVPSSVAPVLMDTLLCPMGNPNILPTKAVHVTPVFLIGVVISLIGSYIRLDCFKALGHLFTFDLTVHPEHSLITNRFYAYVRHPAYTGSMLLITGLTISHFTDGSWMTECGPLTSKVTALIVWAAGWFWTCCVALSRAQAEDAQMKKLFKDEWKVYAAKVPWWFVPGVL